MSLVYLYKYREYVQLLQDDRNVPNVNFPMIIYDTKVYKGVTNYIDFQIRNNDRKPINMVGFDLVVQIREVDNPTNAKASTPILLEKLAVRVDETAGKFRLVLNPEDIADWDSGYYRYNVRTVDPTGVNELLFTDINKSVLGSFELLDGMSSSVVPAKEILFNHFTPSPYTYQLHTEYVTGAIPGDAQDQRPSGTHTFVAYTTKWQGKIWIEGSLSVSPPLPAEWFPVQLTANSDFFEYRDENFVGTKLFNFTMNLFWVRIRIQPSIVNQGKFDKILYKC